VGYSKFENETAITKEHFSCDDTESDQETDQPVKNSIKLKTDIENPPKEESLNCSKINSGHNDTPANSNRKSDSHSKSNSQDKCCYPLPSSKCKLTLFFILGSFQYLAQLAAIPLLIVQMYDTYTLLCFGVKDYCSDEYKYDLHLDHQAILTFAFFCCLGVSFLTSVLMQWDP